MIVIFSFIINGLDTSLKVKKSISFVWLAQWQRPKSTQVYAAMNFKVLIFYFIIKQK